jgi:hypothetical protein
MVDSVDGLSGVDPGDLQGPCELIVRNALLTALRGAAGDENQTSEGENI